MKTKVFFRVMGMVHPRPLYYTGLLGRSLASLLRNLAVALWSRTSIDAALAGDGETLIRATILGFLAMAFMALYYSATNYLFEKGIQNTTAGLRQKVFNSAQTLPYRYHQEHHSGDLISRSTNDIKATEGAYGPKLLRLLEAVLGGVLALAIILLINWQLALFVTLFTVILTFINFPFARLVRRSSREVQKGLGRLTEQLSDMLAGLFIIRVFNLGTILQKTFGEKNQAVLKTSRRRVVHSASLNAINSFTGFFTFAGTMVIGGFFYLQDMASFGDLIFVVQMINSVTFLFTALGTLVTQMQSSLAGAERVLEILDLPREPRIYSHLKNQPQPSQKPAVALQKISFAYPGQDNILQDFQLEIPPGSVQALVGPSGSGKSTIMRLLLGFYPPDKGDIIINGLPLSSTPLDRIRNQIAFVPQEPFLFNGTLGENIALGKPGAKTEEVIAAARAAHAHEFISRLPKGYNTQVGERGTQLSGGQRQRIAIARALLKDAPILLLDEATSSLDSKSEALVQKGLETLLQGKTALIIAHRLSTVENADRIVVLKDGQIQNKGTHNQLLQTSQIYSDLYAASYSA